MLNAIKTDYVNPEWYSDLVRHIIMCHIFYGYMFLGT